MRKRGMTNWATLKCGTVGRGQRGRQVGRLERIWLVDLDANVACDIILLEMRE